MRTLWANSFENLPLTLDFQPPNPWLCNFISTLPVFRLSKNSYFSMTRPKEIPVPRWPISRPVQELFQYLAYDTLNEQFISGDGRIITYLTVRQKEVLFRIPLKSPRKDIRWYKNWNIKTKKQRASKHKEN